MSVVRGAARRGARRGAAYHYARPHGVVSSAAPLLLHAARNLLRWGNLRVGGSMTYLAAYYCDLHSARRGLVLHAAYAARGYKIACLLNTIITRRNGCLWKDGQ